MSEAKEMYCAGCGIEIDLELDQVVVADQQSFCIWCWSNDCCRVSRDAAEAKYTEEEK